MKLYIQFPLAEDLKIKSILQSYNPAPKVMKLNFLLISFISIFIDKKPNCSIEHKLQQNFTENIY